MSLVKLRVRDYSETPGARYTIKGPYSGEAYRTEILEKYFTDPNEKDTIIEVDLDGVLGYATSFLEESFGGLVRKFGRDIVKKKIKIVAKEFEKFKKLADQYIEEADEFSN